MTAETVLVQAHHPYASSRISFRDPFAHDQLRRKLDSTRQVNSPPVSPVPFCRPLDMSNGAPIAWQQDHHNKSHGLLGHGVTVPYTASNPTLSKATNINVPFSNAKALRETLMVSSPASEEWSWQLEQSRSRQGSTTAAIAPSFQIPRSINDSGGSLSELAAEIACLFWFESAELLETIEECPPLSTPVIRGPLTPDARPTTGFRKWVTTILSTTLVAQNVVLLGLLFIHRLKKLNPSVRGKPGSEYRLLTIALMLGNKFLDDNTYTNKTWAEVSGINVSEVHVMEVEFLSNMKYCLYTSADDWTRWQLLLGRFASYVERARNFVPSISPSGTNSIPLIRPTGLSLPSPPASNQASPPYLNEHYSNAVPQPVFMPVLSPAAEPGVRSGHAASRKRSRDESTVESPAKRRVPYSSGPSPQRSSAGYGLSNTVVRRLPLPNLAIPGVSISQQPSLSQIQTLPSVVSRPAVTRTSNLTPCPGPSVVAPPTSAPLGSFPSSIQPALQMPLRQQSPYADSRTVSPTGNQPISASSLHPPNQVSPSYLLQQRSSPYRPVHHVSTLLHPPPSSALHHKLPTVGQDRMHYQPLGKPIQHQQSGCLPYVAQNVWMHGAYPQAMTPVHQWPSFDYNMNQALATRQ